MKQNLIQSYSQEAIIYYIARYFIRFFDKKYAIVEIGKRLRTLRTEKEYT